MNTNTTTRTARTDLHGVEIGTLVALTSGEVAVVTDLIIDEVDPGSGFYRVVAVEVVTEGNEIIELPC